MKKSTKSIIVLVIGIIIFAFGVWYPVPNNFLSEYGGGFNKVEKYVGGDAYNFIVASSLLGGQISGNITSKAIFMCTGIILFCIGLINIPSKIETIEDINN